MKCPFCEMASSFRKGDKVQFGCGMVMEIDHVWEHVPERIESYRIDQPTACVRNERDRYLRLLLQCQSEAQKLRAAGEALARHVGEDTRGRAARQLVQAWEEAAQ